MMALLNLFEYEEAAMERMAAPYYEYYAGGVADNVTLRDNRAAFERLRLRPRMLRDVSRVSTETAVLGIAQSMPALIAPAAMHKLAHPDGELAMARAAKALGVTQVLSTLSTTAVEEVAAVGHSLWFQLYLFRDRALNEMIVRRAVDAGCQALVLTVDLPIGGLRENLVRADFSTPPDLPFPNLVPPGDERTVSELRQTAADLDPGLTWDDVSWLREVSDLPLWVKGILRADDALRAVQAGVSGIMVSNHGGRQLDTAVAAIDALPEIVEAVGDQVELLVDGGVRRGVDVLKALALGADGVMLGRPPLWGLAVDGEAGAAHVLQILKDELANAMALCGCTAVGDIGPDLIFRNGRGTAGNVQ
jgi:4-hydroxymandelate oxidase